ncbi:MAG: hypothetical protein JW910_16220, partial [Anaerolineae bacterium]|nr:hypothetical protein [Anaerolineae bacterium]
MRRLIWLLVLGLLSLAAFPALAGAPWSVWLYHPESRQLVQVNNFGEAQTFALALPLDAEMDGLPAFFRSGDWIAYCIRDSQDRLSVQIEALEGAPTYGLALPTAYDLDYAAACRLGPAAFNAFGDPLLAVGVLDGETGMSDSWRLLVFDLMAGTVAYDLAPDDEAYLAAAGEPVQAVALPVVLRFEQDLVLRLEPVSAEESGEPVAFRWNPETGDVIRAPEFDRAYDILQSGE